MSLSKIATLTFAAVILVGTQLVAEAAPRFDHSFSRYVYTGMGPYETGIDVAKGNLR